MGLRELRVGEVIRQNDIMRMDYDGRANELLLLLFIGFFQAPDSCHWGLIF